MRKSFFNWSSGKDSALALYYAMQNPDIDISYLFSVINSDTDRVGMHEISASLLMNQADSIGIPLRLLRTSFDSSYAADIKEEMDFFKSQEIDTSIFGDVFLEELREYRELKCRNLGFKTMFPLWGMSSYDVVNAFVSLGFKAVVVSIDDTKLPNDYLGSIIDSRFIENFPEGSDICGENGEYHSFVFDGPIFRHPVNYSLHDNIIKADNYSHLILE